MGLFDDDTCDGCLYAVPAIDTGNSEPFMLCRRYPAALIVDQHGKVIEQTFPTAVMRCGEYTESPSV